ncbi:hypothetical protein H7827_23805 [Streptomyces sp. JH002]|uniref:hypothetical protein n=1 Tax=Streptomyces sp. JH002 TaxID=2763259 RepID=UPI003D804563
MTPLYVDTGWVLNVQLEVGPPSTPIRDWGALQCMAERHRYERFAGEAYYEEAVTRAATFLHTALLLEPFADFNAAIGAACARMYLDLSEQPISPPPGAMAQLTRSIREHKTDLQDTARQLRDWRP